MPTPSLIRAFLPRHLLHKTLFCCVAAVSTTSLLAQSGIISSDSLTPFNPRDVGASSGVKTVRVRLNHDLALISIAIAPGFTEFSMGSVTGCIIDGHTVNPAFTVCEVPVIFQPKYPGFRTAPLLVTDNTGTNYSLGLEGTALAPQAAFTPGIITTVAGTAVAGYKGDGGVPTHANLSFPQQVAVDGAGNLYIADCLNNRIRKVDTSGIITTFAGNGTSGFGGDGGPAIRAPLNFPDSVAVDAAGNLYIADSSNNRIRRVDVNGIIATVAGNGTTGFSGDGGDARKAALNLPTDVAVDTTGNLYVADSTNNRIRKVDTNGIITTFAGAGAFGDPFICDVPNYGGDRGSATDALLGNPQGVTVDGQGNVYIADYCNRRIRKVNTSGIILTIAGNGTEDDGGDGGLATSAQLWAPVKLAVDAAGNLYIADFKAIRKVDTTGRISTVAGRGVHSGNNIPATSALMTGVNAVTTDSAGNLYLAAGNVVRKVDVSRSAIFFAPHIVGTTSPANRILLTNIGNEHLEVGTLDIKGDFGFLTGDDPSYCSTTPNLGPGLSCGVPITFSPPDAGDFTGAAIITDNTLNQPGTTQTVGLSGTGVNP
jgi:trimeric autotransporter adhesin